ncbi:hypothetical protein ACH5AL_36580 [Actinacidiphila glaucinigra]|uniref:hypothetical protein n=1 Tax=Actinacidiphila glaucinigra TaxID=235986 RepID=UPI0029BEDD4A|nr:hypothetical protein [Streptomyces sp. PA03-3a]
MGNPGTPARLGVLQAAHQHADTKAGVLAAAQAALIGTSGSWAADMAATWRQGGFAGWAGGGLLAGFVVALVGGALCVALALLPRLWRTDTPSPHSFTRPGPLTPDAGGEDSDEEVVDFLSRLAVMKFRLVAGAVLGTVAMGVCAGLAVVLGPLLAG